MRGIVVSPTEQEGLQPQPPAATAGRFRIPRPESPGSAQAEEEGAICAAAAAVAAAGMRGRPPRPRLPCSARRLSEKFLPHTACPLAVL